MANTLEVAPSTTAIYTRLRERIGQRRDADTGAAEGLQILQRAVATSAESSEFVITSEVEQKH